VKSNILLMGEIGTGKTTGLRTLLPEYIDSQGKVQRGAGLETFLIAMEPGWEAALGNHTCDMGLHVRYLPPAAVGWEVIHKYVTLAHTMSIDALLKIADPGRSHYTQFMELFNTCKDFRCDRCGESFGDVSTWDDSRAICGDGLTSLTTMALQAIVGGKPIKSLPEYGVTMEFIESFFKLFWGNTQCTAVFTAHIDREVNPVTGLSTITAHTLGQKLAPKLVKIPDEVILCKHERNTYRWSTVDDLYILKHRRLPESDTLVPSFAQLFR
jgi:hypothetical protein